MVDAALNSLLSSTISVGDHVTPMDIEVTSTAVVAGALASHDYMPMHHDRDFAQSQGAPDIFLNIMSTNAYIARFITDWAGPEASLKNINVRLGMQAVPGNTLKLRGTVNSKEATGDECLVEIAVQASVEAGDHATGTVLVSVPI